MAVSSIILSKTLDNGVICASEQSAIVHEAVYEAFLAEGSDRAGLSSLVVQGGKVNGRIVGQAAPAIAAMAGFEVPADTKLLVAEAVEVGPSEPLSYEKLSPVLALYKVGSFEEGVEKAAALVEFAGLGHTSVLYTAPANKGRIEAYAARMKTGRVLVNMPSSQGAIGDLFNFRLEPPSPWAAAPGAGTP